MWWSCLGTAAGQYWIKPAAAATSYVVYCDMETYGGGFTLLTAQADDRYFDNNNWLSNDATHPKPTSSLFSILGKGEPPGIARAAERPRVGRHCSAVGLAAD
jgi:hypothetical protein